MCWLQFLRPLSTMYQLYRGGQFIRYRSLEYLKKRNEPPKVNGKLLSNTVESNTPMISL